MNIISLKTIMEREPTNAHVSN